MSVRIPGLGAVDDSEGFPEIHEIESRTTRSGYRPKRSPPERHVRQEDYDEENRISVPPCSARCLGDLGYIAEPANAISTREGEMCHLPC